MPHAYEAFGLTLLSDFAGPRLAPSRDRPADVTIREREVPRPGPDRQDTFVFSAGTEDVFLSWPQVGKFLVRAGREVDVETAPGGACLRHLPLLGPVMAMLLHQRDRFVLHASAVLVNGRGVAFLGDKGTGKSTTASAVLASGGALLSDDVVAVEPSEANGFQVPAAYPFVKLDPRSGSLLDAVEGILREDLAPDLPKQRHVLPAGSFAAGPAALAAIFALERGPLRLRPLPPPEGLRVLLRYAYASRFGAAAFGPERAARQLRQVSRIASSVPIFRLTIPDGLGRLGEAVELVRRACG